MRISSSDAGSVALAAISFSRQSIISSPCVVSRVVSDVISSDVGSSVVILLVDADQIIVALSMTEKNNVTVRQHMCV